MNEYLIQQTARLIRPIHRLIYFLSPFVNFLARLWIAKIFFLSGLVKVHDWHATLLLFQYEYQVPLLNSIFAAYLGTAIELILPVLLLIGFGGRTLIFTIFIYNILCVVSYHFLWTLEGRVALGEHVSWGLLLLLLTCSGMGKFSLDYLIYKRFGHYLS